MILEYDDSSETEYIIILFFENDMEKELVRKISNEIYDNSISSENIGRSLLILYNYKYNISDYKWNLLKKLKTDEIERILRMRDSDKHIRFLSNILVRIKGVS